MARVLGIDAGGLGGVSWLAFLESSQVTLSQHVFTQTDLSLPWLADADLQCIAVDAPQGLPLGGKRRLADELARTPTNRLPKDRAELTANTASDIASFPFIAVVRLGIELFWANREHVLGVAKRPRLIESYPRRTFLNLSRHRLPSKTKQRAAYCDTLVEFIANQGITPPTGASVDHLDAILCAMAARAFVEGTAEELGAGPGLDRGEGLLREGRIIVPQHERSATSA